MNATDVSAVLNDPLSQELMSSPIPARIAYTGLDGSPRAVPIGFHWNGQALVIATEPSTPKVAALRSNPAVALTIDTNEFPPNVLLIRGTVTIEIVEGVPEEYLAASRKVIAEEGWSSFEANVRQTYAQMAKITVTPTWAKVMDFETRVPSFLERIMKEAQEA